MRQLSIRFHRVLALIGGMALLIWASSGLLHPIMTTWGPQQAVFYPPSEPVNLTGSVSIPETIRYAGIDEARAIRVIASDGENLLQVTEDPLAPRRYFELDTGSERESYDEAHAIYLARYYTGETGAIRSVEHVTEFSPAYPQVNRLLPVYKVTFDRADNQSIYIYTETNAVAGMGNSFKNTLQTAFQWLHTWSWFPKEADWARVVLIGLLLITLFALGVTGVFMLVLIRRKVKAPGVRGLHRIAGYALALPILTYSASGFYHLITAASTSPALALRLSDPIDLAATDFDISDQWAEISSGLNVSSVSIIRDSNGSSLYRLGIAADRSGGPTSAAEIRNARFDGVERTGPAVYLNARTGEAVQNGDREIATRMAESFTGISREQFLLTALVTRFGPEYDFRNKRLPVWQFDIASPVNATIFVDTATGVLADVSADETKLERLSFSLLHKLNFLRGFGRHMPNLAASVIMVLLLGFMAILGLQMDLKRRSRRAKKRQH